MVKRICVICSQEFETSHSRQKTCSIKCSKINKQRRHDELYKENYDRYEHFIRKPNPFGTYEKFCRWAKRQLKGIILEDIAKKF